MSATIRRLYVRLPNWVGDVVMATAVLDTLREQLPQAHITVESPGFQRSLLAGLGSFDTFLPAPGKRVADVLNHGKLLRAERFDAALILADSVRTALPPFLARIPVRVGFARDAVRRFLLTRALKAPADADGKRVPTPMPSRYQEALLGLLPDAPAEPGLVRLAVSDTDRSAVAARLASCTPPVTGGYLVLTPGAAFGASKLYPAVQSAEAADGIARACDLSVVLAPGPGEEPLAHEIAALMTTEPTLLVDPVTTLGQLNALIDDASMLLANDTGPRHVAVAVDTPVVCLMGPTDRRHTDYQLTRQRVLREEVDCSPCHLKICPIDHRCMTRLAPPRVVAAAVELLAGDA